MLYCRHLIYFQGGNLEYHLTKNFFKGHIRQEIQLPGSFIFTKMSFLGPRTEHVYLSTSAIRKSETPKSLVETENHFLLVVFHSILLQCTSRETKSE
ncbi:hypothetical protein AB205_0077340 [Aquarana catesbeiana]|uniref:Uncharacterized protein n=1 Tax=Aquarana catesbeiana TaxID=8400 RepID=A0A2G9S868_AQUCT|nr:hypothetical protein AB205_0077340 [Aquarana catesbeiana]